MVVNIVSNVKASVQVDVALHRPDVVDEVAPVHFFGLGSRYRFY
eukprot:CAMPEP_0176469880 /NCGR_PEP_ID=MMETSP0127-20121128/40137_1 /TAXON_ID=938130 /ORGANISM="Platyophrya macrostoma, Strain WH" /LENGTH=43 /DNA_ID= /DNA_START= /DNA_END= /DNA_ORIENTATION=